MDECYLGSLAEEEPILLDHGSPTPESNFTELDEELTSLRCISAPANRKLSRQRSFSADYQTQDIPSHEAPPRRFSASPNIGTHRYNNNCHTPHAQQISVDSEESFITIIPAIRSARQSITDTNTFENLTDFDEEDEIQLSENDAEELFSSSDENDDDAYCESLSCTSDDNTSVSSGLELTVKSIITKSQQTLRNGLQNNDSSDSTQFSTDDDEMDDDDVDDDGDVNEHDDDCNSLNEHLSDRQLFHDNATPPSILHHYFHVFYPDELENIIRNYVTDLDLIETSFEPESGTWFVVAEKIRVWTI